jgi:hypothetical protein
MSCSSGLPRTVSAVECEPADMGSVHHQPEASQLAKSSFRRI